MSAAMLVLGRLALRLERTHDEHQADGRDEITDGRATQR